MNNKKSYLSHMLVPSDIPAIKILLKDTGWPYDPAPSILPTALPNCATWAATFVPKHLKCRFQNTFAKNNPEIRSMTC